VDKVRYDAPRGGDVKVLSAATAFIVGSAAILAVGSVGQTLYSKYDNPAVMLVPLVFLVTPGLLLFALRGEAPTGYTLDDIGVHIERRAGAATIPLSAIREVRELPPQVSFIRIGGSGGWYGYYGEFKSRDLGQVTMYATRSDDRVLLATDGRNYVITPASPAAFVADLESRLVALNYGAHLPAATDL
jgi:hypothetical protein